MSEFGRFSGYTTRLLMEEIDRLDHTLNKCNAYGVESIDDLRQILVDMLEERTKRERKLMRGEVPS